MVNEHYVPQSYLRLFAPPNEGLVARYSLVEKHGGGDYVPPIDRYSIRKAASAEDFASGLLETDNATLAENAMASALGKIIEKEPLEWEDIAHISRFLALQHSRTVESKLHYEARKRLREIMAEAKNRKIGNSPIDRGWEAVLAHNVDETYHSLQHFGWLIIENKTEIPFITSDQPVVHYFEEDRDEIRASPYQFKARQIFCPIDPDHLLLLLDPWKYRVDGQYPDTELERKSIANSREIWKFNLLQGINAFQEVFGPRETGEELERLIDVLSSTYPHKHFIRGNYEDLETVERAERIAAGGPETETELEWYIEVGKPLMQARRMSAQAIWAFSHDISLVEELRRDEVNDGYWEEILEDPVRA